MATSCDIQGSADASIQNVEIADLHIVLSRAKIEKILLNGSLAYDLFFSKYADSNIPFIKMPSTSPANPRFQKEVWEKELQFLFK